MGALALDTYAAIKKLKQAGFTEQQAEAQTALLSEVVTGELATKHDLKDLESVFKGDLKDLETALRQDMFRLEGKLQALEERTEGRFRLLQWMLGFNMALTIAVLFLLLKH